VDKNGNAVIEKDTHREGIAGSTETHKKIETDRGIPRRASGSFDFLIIDGYDATWRWHALAVCWFCSRSSAMAAPLIQLVGRAGMPSGGRRDGAGRPNGACDRLPRRGSKLENEIERLKYVTGEIHPFAGDSLALMQAVYRGEYIATRRGSPPRIFAAERRRSG
jgi:hypothetical protein